MRSFRAHRIDAIQPSMVAALRKAGATVQSLSLVGHGCPDLLVGYHGQNLLMECKAPAEQHGNLNDTQQVWHDMWQGQVAVVRSPEEALNVIRD